MTTTTTWPGWLPAHTPPPALHPYPHQRLLTCSALVLCTDGDKVDVGYYVVYRDGAGHWTQFEGAVSGWMPLPPPHNATTDDTPLGPVLRRMPEAARRVAASYRLETVGQLRTLSAQQLRDVPGVGTRTAEAIRALAWFLPAGPPHPPDREQDDADLDDGQDDAARAEPPRNGHHPGAT